MTHNPPTANMFDVETIRRDFPILQRKVHGKPLIWLDSAATTQKPQVVIDRVSRFYEHENSNIHRGTHTLATEASTAYEGARAKVAAFMGAASPQEIVFVRGTTEGINLLAAIFTETLLQPGDEIVLTEAEHHANIVPWQFAAKKSGAVIRVAPVDDNGDLILKEYERLLGPRTRVVSITHISNALGTVMPVHEMTMMAKRHGATVAILVADGGAAPQDSPEPGSRGRRAVRGRNVSFRIWDMMCRSRADGSPTRSSRSNPRVRAAICPSSASTLRSRAGSRS